MQRFAKTIRHDLEAVLDVDPDWDRRQLDGEARLVLICDMLVMGLCILGFATWVNASRQV